MSLKGHAVTWLELHNKWEGWVVFKPSWCNASASPASAAGGAGHAAEVMALLNGVTPRISATAASLVLLIGVSAAVQRFSEEPVDLVARLGDTVSGNMSAAAALLLSLLPDVVSAASDIARCQRLAVRQIHFFLVGKDICFHNLCTTSSEWSFGLWVLVGQPAGLNSCWWRAVQASFSCSSCLTACHNLKYVPTTNLQINPCNQSHLLLKQPTSYQLSRLCHDMVPVVVLSGHILNCGCFAHFMQLCPSVSEEHRHEMNDYIRHILDNTARLTSVYG